MSSSSSLVSPSAFQIITRKKAQYGRYVDTKQLPFLSTILLPDAKIAFHAPSGELMKVPGGPTLLFTGPSQMSDFLGPLTRNTSTVHIFSLAEMTQVSEDEIKVVWGMQDMVVRNNTLGLARISGGGYYHETWRRVKGEDGEEDWMIEEMRLRRTYETMTWLYVVLAVLAILGLPVA